MINYYGPFSSRLGSAVFLGQDAIIVPTNLPKAPPPDPVPAGPQPAPAVTPVPAASADPTVSIGGRNVSVVSLAVVGMLALGGIGVALSTASSMKRRSR